MANPRQEPPGPEPRVGWVFSGGSAKGLAHIGVIRVLEDAGVPVHFVVGTSMGSIVGGLHAIGYSADDLARVASGMDWDGLFRTRVDRRLTPPDRKAFEEGVLLTVGLEGRNVRLPQGLVSGQRLGQELSALTLSVHTESDFRAFPIPFSAIATDLESGEAIQLERGFLADALRASMAIPSIFEPVRIDGRLLADGGLIRNLPAQDAVRMGAEVLICSDVSEERRPATDLRSFLDVVNQAVALQMERATQEQRDLCTVLIRPEISDLSPLDFGAPEEWIARGEKAAIDALPRLREMGLVGRAPREGSLVPRPEVGTGTVRYRTLRIEGLPPEEGAILRQRLGIPEAGEVDLREVSRAVERAYARGSYHTVDFRLRVVDGDTSLVVHANPGDNSHVGFGFRYDRRHKATLLFRVVLEDWLGPERILRGSLRLGEQLELGVDHVRALELRRSWLIGASGALRRYPIDLFEGAGRVAQVQVDAGRVGGTVNRMTEHAGIVGVHATAEWVRSSSEIAAVADAESHRRILLGGYVWRDTFDRVAFPRVGHAIRASSDWAGQSLGSSVSMAQHTLSAKAAFSGAGPWTLLVGLEAGVTQGPSAVPIPYRFTLGGVHPYALDTDRHLRFPGLQSQAASGASVYLLSLGGRWALREGLFVTLEGNVGGTTDELPFPAGEHEFGGAVSLGALTFLGPLSGSVAGARGRQGMLFELSMGHDF